MNYEIFSQPPCIVSRIPHVIRVIHATHRAFLSFCNDEIRENEEIIMVHRLMSTDRLQHEKDTLEIIFFNVIIFVGVA
jgi:hypothetical protein